MSPTTHTLTDTQGREQRSHFWVAWAIVAAFGTYFCIYFSQAVHCGQLRRRSDLGGRIQNRPDHLTVTGDWLYDLQVYRHQNRRGDAATTAGRHHALADPVRGGRASFLRPPAATLERGLLVLQRLTAGHGLMLSRIPPPTPRDIAARSERGPMGHAERNRFLRRYAWGLIPLVLLDLSVKSSAASGPTSPRNSGGHSAAARCPVHSPTRNPSSRSASW